MEDIYTISYGFSYEAKDSIEDSLPEFMKSEDYLKSVDKLFNEILNT